MLKVAALAVALKKSPNLSDFRSFLSEAYQVYRYYMLVPVPVLEREIINLAIDTDQNIWTYDYT